jgi:hypothetical protein
MIEPPDRERHERSPDTAADFLVGFDLPPSRQPDERPAPGTAVTRVGVDTDLSTAGEARSSEPEPRSAAFALYDNVYVLVPQTEQLDPAEAAELGLNATTDNVDQFDLPERDRMYELAKQFVRNHVRTVKSGSALQSQGRSFSDRAIVVSEKKIPRLPLRHAKVSWAIDRNAVIDVHDHKVLSARLTKVEIPSRRFIWGPGQGDTFDVPYLLSNLCAILSMHVPDPVAATGVVALGTNQILGNDPIEDKRLAASRSRMAHLILPFRAHLMPGLHDGVRYWPARDVDEAIYSLFSAACADRAIPNLKFRWRTKMVASWISLFAALAVYGAMELSSGFGGDPSFSRLMFGVALALFATSSFATHRYWRIDQ